MAKKDVELEKLENDIHSLRVKSSRLSSLIQKKTESLCTASDSPGIDLNSDKGGHESKIGIRTGLTTGLARGSKPLVSAARTTGPRALQTNSSRSKLTSTTGPDLGPNTGINFAANHEKEINKRREKSFK